MSIQHLLPGDATAPAWQHVGHSRLLPTEVERLARSHGVIGAGVRVSRDIYGHNLDLPRSYACVRALLNRRPSQRTIRSRTTCVHAPSYRATIRLRMPWLIRFSLQALSRTCP